MVIQKITPFLWYDSQAEEAANFYVRVFPNSKVNKVVRYGETGPGPAGSAMTVQFQLDGQSFTALNGGPIFKFTEAVSFVVHCQTQEEVDRYWQQLSVGGAESQCGWLKDKFGLSWQIVPRPFIELMKTGEPAKKQQMFAAMMQMRKLDWPKLQAAYDS